MAHLKILPAKAFLVIAILISDINTYQDIEAKGVLPNLETIIDLVQNILRYKSNSTFNFKPIFRTAKLSGIENFINRKIDELMPFMQDNEEESLEIENEHNSNITLDGDDETTIIEFVPPNGEKKNLRNDAEKEKDLLKTDIEKYKKMRKKIKAALEMEFVSEKTQKMVTKTLDSMIAELIGNKCSWNRSPNGIEEEKKTLLIARRWNKQWLQFKKQYLRYARSNPDTSTLPAMKLFKFFEQFHDFLSHIVEDTDKISDRYKIECQFIERKEGNDKALRKGSKDTCQSFKLCSGELSSFLNDLYESMNNTAVSAFRNYGSMYVRDVNTAQSGEKEAVVMTVNEIGDLVEHKIENIFKNVTEKLKFDKNKRMQNNMKTIKHYINKLINNAINDIKNSLGEDLRPLGKRLQVYITQDLSVNVDLDLNNLREDLKANICEKFSSCNGKFNARRQNDFLSLGDYTKNSVYVKVQLNLDKDIKDKLVSRIGQETEKDLNIPEAHKMKHKKYKIKKNKKHKSKGNYSKQDYTRMELIEPDLERKHFDASVTRTTNHTFSIRNITMKLIEPYLKRKHFEASVTRTTHKIYTIPNVTHLKNVKSSTTLPTSITTVITKASTVTRNIVNKTHAI